MALTIDYTNLLVLSDASITDVVAFHRALRDFEDNPDGMLYPVIHTYKEIDLGSGAVFPAVAFINGWQLKFPTPGNYEIKGGNIVATVVPVAGVFVKQTQGAAYAVTSIGSGGATPADIAAAVLAALNATTIPVDTQKINGYDVIGDGTEGNAWRGVGVSP